MNNDYVTTPMATPTPPTATAVDAVEVETVVYTDTKQPNDTDMANAARFATDHTGAACYVGEWGWLLYDADTGCWQRDVSGAVTESAKYTARKIYSEALVELKRAHAHLEEAMATGVTDTKQYQDAIDRAAHIMGWAKKSQSAARLKAMVELGATEGGIYAQMDWFDSNPYFLNCANGILDLRTGQLLPHDPTHFITHHTPVSYDPQATAPTWLAFLARIFDNDTDMIAFVQRAIGYTLTGDTGEQCLFFMYGMGANGKSTLANTVSAMLGDYANTVNTEALMYKNYGSGIPNDIAALTGLRMVIASELPQGKRLNETLIKQLTGGDAISARHMRSEWFTFTPRFKLWMFGNHKPNIAGTDDGIWRRLRTLPFTVQIPESEQDTTLGDKLQSELPGILAWAVAGCQQWQRERLSTPDKVTAATADYRQSQDAIGRFVEECCVTGVNMSVRYRALYDAYKLWAETYGEYVMRGKSFGEAMTERGFMADNGTGNVAIRRGIGLLATEEER